VSLVQAVGFWARSPPADQPACFRGYGWIAWQQFREKRGLALSVTCLGLILTSLLGLMVSSGGWLVLAFQALYCAAILLLIWQAWRGPISGEAKAVISLVGAALLAGRLYQAVRRLTPSWAGRSASVQRIALQWGRVFGYPGCSGAVAALWTESALVGLAGGRPAGAGFCNIPPAGPSDGRHPGHLGLPA